MYSQGVKTNRDEWVWDFDRSHVLDRVAYLVDAYSATLRTLPSSLYADEVDDYVGTDIKWTRKLKKLLVGRSELALEGGILGRCDDMTVIRGVNVYPAAVEQIIRNVPGVAEYRVHVRSEGALAELEIEIEPERNCADAAATLQAILRAFQDNMSLRVSARTVDKLPRFEMKAQRWVRD